MLDALAHSDQEMELRNYMAIPTEGKDNVVVLFQLTLDRLVSYHLGIHLYIKMFEVSVPPAVGLEWLLWMKLVHRMPCP